MVFEEKMSVSYRKIQKIIGPLIFLNNEHGVQYGEIVKIHSDDGIVRTGQVVKIDENIIVIEAFEDTKGLSLENSKIFFSGKSFIIDLSDLRRRMIKGAIISFNLSIAS